VVNVDPPITFVLFLCKILKVVPKYTRATVAQNKLFCTQTYFGGPVTPPPHTKPRAPVKNGETNFLRQAIQEPIFSVANADFEGGGDGRSCGDYIFLAK
jgi:hypothetical protein